LVNKAVDKANENWILCMAKEAEEAVNRLQQLMQDKWRDGEDWKDTKVVPVQKRRIYRTVTIGISLLDVVGKCWLELSRKGFSTLQKHLA